jgi:hypothetical protein
MDTGLSSGTARAALRRHPDLVLLALAIVSLVLLPVRIGDAYSGLPAHPLFLHVPVVLLPLVTTAAVILVLRLRWLARFGLLIALIAVIALVGTILTAGAGEALRSSMNQGQGASGFPGTQGGATQGGAQPSGGTGGFARQPNYVAQHARAARQLRLLVIAFTIVLILLVIADRVARNVSTLGRLATLMRRRSTGLALRVLVVALSAACFVMVIHVGDLGAKAVWANRVGGGGQGGQGFPVSPGQTQTNQTTPSQQGANP